MSIRVWWLITIFTSAVGVAILFEEPPPNGEAKARPPQQAAGEAVSVDAQQVAGRGG